MACLLSIMQTSAPCGFFFSPFSVIRFLCIHYPMYLKQLSIQGFKSFANKTVLEFRPPAHQKESKGITAIIGPNGSGKSNIADSIRWALGEQSLKLLRGKKSEDIIFGGSQKASRLSRAEVSITIDNSDRSADIEYEQLIITRRLYRNGESEYLLNGSPTQLSAIQLLLAQAHIGQKNYAVIGQGMIDAVLIAGANDRKEFFDEATGVKQFQIKRDVAARKLNRTTQALTETTLLLQEIEPRLKLLDRQVKRWHQREEIATNLHSLEQSYYSYLWHEVNSQHKLETTVAQELQTQLEQNEQSIKILHKEFDDLTKTQSSENFETLQAQQRALHHHIQTLRQEKTRIEHQYEHQLEIHGHGDIAWIHKRAQDIQDERVQTESNANELTAQHNNIKAALDTILTQEHRIHEKISQHKDRMKRMEIMLQNLSPHELQQELHKLIREHDALIQETNHAVIQQKIKAISERLKILAEKISPQRATAHELVAAQHDLERLLTERDSITQHIQNHNLELSVVAQQLKLTKERYEHLSHEHTTLTTKLQLARGATPQSAEKIKKQLSIMETQLQELQKQSLDIEQKISELYRADQRRNTEMARVQSAMRDASEANHTTEHLLHERAVTIARLEQKKEDLLHEMKQELSVELYTTIITMETAPPLHATDTASLIPHIQRLRKQLEHIGEVDETIVSEHTETQNRFVFLSEQSKDLYSSTNHLQRIIRELDEKIETQFAKSFKQINEHFNHYFKILFGGGKATLSYHKRTEGFANIKTDEQLITDTHHDLSQENLIGTEITEIDITACPPHKKITTITALSGGERSLTAIALLCAIIASHPAPFIVLDEVDAALDEANSERFATILEDLSHLTQFIAITHNRATMHKANLLYGVTMNEDASSRLFSVQLEDIQPMK